MNDKRARKFLESRVKILRKAVESMQGNDIFDDDKEMRIVIANMRESLSSWEDFLREDTPSPTLRQQLNTLA